MLSFSSILVRTCNTGFIKTVTVSCQRSLLLPPTASTVDDRWRLMTFFICGLFSDLQCDCDGNVVRISSRCSRHVTIDECCVDLRSHSSDVVKNICIVYCDFRVLCMHGLPFIRHLLCRFYVDQIIRRCTVCLLYTSPSPRD